MNFRLEFGNCATVQPILSDKRLSAHIKSIESVPQTLGIGHKGITDPFSGSDGVPDLDRIWYGGQFLAIVTLYHKSICAKSGIWFRLWHNTRSDLCHHADEIDSGNRQSLGDLLNITGISIL